MRPLTLIRLGVIFCVSSVCGFAMAKPAGDEVFLFSYFIRNGEDGLHLATSEDGLKWTALRDGASFLTPVVGENKLMRDPCILRGPDGVYRMVWTTSWTGTTIGYASSKDLKTWSEQKALPVMAHEPTTANCWAPELVWDDAKQHYVIFWSSTVPGKFLVPDETERKDAASGKPPRNHRLYATTTKDFETFTPTRLLYEPGINVIDETMVRDGKDWVMFAKNETEIPAAAKNIYVVRGSSPEGPWTKPSAPLPPAGVWVEGATAIKIGKWWHLYFDKYRDHQYGVIRSKDLANWEDISEQLIVPKGIRHGTVLRVPRALIEALK
ncbi:glycoside hydrolase family 43 protein [Oleiharenicola lentus]|uniref:glycoside hydrolase family 43 protein n=1 Tax=Oleiharenicola lentus TaxID=2508720 RepID=UPI003F664052